MKLNKFFVTLFMLASVFLLPMPSFAVDNAASVKVGTTTTEYATFSDALTAAKANSGSTLKLLKNHSGNIEIDSGTFTLDATGFTFNGKIYVKGTANLTVSGGTFTANSQTLIYEEENANSRITINGGTFNRTVSAFHLYINDGEFKIVSVGEGEVCGGEFELLNLSENLDNGNKANLIGGQFKKIACNLSKRNISYYLSSNSIIKYNGVLNDGNVNSLGDTSDSNYNILVLPKPITGVEATLDKTSVEYGSKVTLSLSNLTVGTEYNANNITVSYKEDSGAWSTPVLWNNASAKSYEFGGSVGSHTAYYKLTLDGYTVEGSKSYTIEKRTPTFTKPTGLTATYGDTLNDVALTTGFSWESPLQTPVGNVGDRTFTVKFTPSDLTIEKEVENIPVTINVKKASVTYTAPQGVQGLVFDGNLKDLHNLGSATNGKMQYSLDNSNWGTSILQGKDAKTYKVWYRVIGDSNYEDLAATYIEVKIAEKPIEPIINLKAPKKNETATTTLEENDYTATVVWQPTVEENGTFAKNTEYTATITVTPKANYTTVGIDENGYTLDGATSVTNEVDSNVITAVFPKTAGSSGGGGTSRYTVKFDTDGGNTITNQIVIKNSKVTEPTVPTKEGYVFNGWYTDSKFTTKYDFDTKVTKNITLYAKWVEDEVQEPSDDKKDDEQKPPENEWKNPFADVTKDDWFFDNVRYANENGLMSGTTDTTFAPNDSLTRAMLVTVLYRAEGEPAVNKSIPFTDVNASQYYANAVIWAEQNGIVKGVSETEFAPDENITREQIATIIYRYAKYKGYDVSVGEDTNILSYTDFDEISEYAIEAMQYAVGSGLIKGKTENTLNPKDNATRAEIAAILGRFIEGNK